MKKKERKQHFHALFMQGHCYACIQTQTAVVRYHCVYSTSTCHCSAAGRCACAERRAVISSPLRLTQWSNGAFLSRLVKYLLKHICCSVYVHLCVWLCVCVCMLQHYSVTRHVKIHIKKKKTFRPKNKVQWLYWDVNVVSKKRRKKKVAPRCHQGELCVD